MAVLSAAEPLPAWAELLAQQSPDLARLLLAHEAREPALESPWIVDVRLPEGACLEAPLPDTITLEIAELAAPHRVFARLAAGQHCILLRGMLQRLPDYRSLLVAAFEKLAIGGFLVVIVPHQFLYERKLQLPSRYERGHLRFYTPAALMAEVEEALPASCYRLRLLADDDVGFDYEAPLARVPAGGHDIVLCLEKTAQPARCGKIEKDAPAGEPTAPVLPPDEGMAVASRLRAPGKGGGRRLLILKLDHRGDFMMAIPAFRVLRRAFPDAAMTLVCGGWNRGEAEALGLFDRVRPFNFFPEDGSAEAAAPPVEDLYAAFVERLAGESYDVAIDLRFYGETRPLLRELDVPHKAGFDTYGEFPWLTIPFSLPGPTGDGRAEAGFFAAAEFHTVTGLHQGVAIEFRDGVAAADRRYLIHGPYGRLRPGHYEFEVVAEARAEEFELAYDIVAGSRLFAAGPLRIARDRHARVALHLQEAIERFEFRIAPAAGAVPPFRFLGLRYRHRGAFLGVHQREAMALLAQLVALRLANARAVVRE